MASLVRATGTIGGLTLVSRILGLVRDQLFALFVGAGLASDCFLIAFRLPNLFRALFAEGAFSAAFVPMFSREIGAEGRDLAAGKAFAEAVLAVLLPFLIVFTALMVVFAAPVVWAMTGGFPDAPPQKVALAIEFTRITFPYLLLISLVSLLGGILNSVGRFWVNAAAPILLNAALIAGLVIFHGDSPVASARVQSVAVTVAGILQFGWLVWACHRAGIDLRLRLPRLTPPVRQLLRRIGPAALGAGAVQINLVISTSLAARFLGQGAISYLYYADRLNQLPLGLVGIGIGTVLLPTLSRQLAGKLDAAALHTQNRAIELVLLLTLPAASALVVSALPIVRTLFEHGRFTNADSVATARDARRLLARPAGVRADQGADAGLPRARRHDDAGADRGRLDGRQSRRQRRADLEPGICRHRAVDGARGVGQRGGAVLDLAQARAVRGRPPAAQERVAAGRGERGDGGGAGGREPRRRAVHGRRSARARGGAGGAGRRRRPRLCRRGIRPARVFACRPQGPTAKAAGMNRVFSGIQPTGNLHLGNYLGAIRQWVAMQADYDCIYCIVDLHAITLPHDPKALAAATRDMAAGILAAGVDPARAILFAQSGVTAHAELAWVLMSIARTGWLDRMIQFKEKRGKDAEGPSVGLYTYPVLQAADILAYRATHVPVGEDQKQHLELARDIAIKFNATYGDLLVPPQPVIGGAGGAARIMSLRDGTAKMSKSDPSPASRIDLTDTADTIAAKIRRAKTDAEPLPQTADGLDGRPEARNLVGLYAALAGTSVAAVLAEWAGKGFGAFKPALADVMVAALAPINAEYVRLRADPGHLESVLRDGAARAGAIAAPLLAEVYDAVGFLR